MEVNKISEEKFKTPSKPKSKFTHRYSSPDHKRLLERNLGYQSFRNRMVSPEKSTKNDQIS